MVHSESSILSSLRGGDGGGIPCSKDELAINGSYTDPMGRRKSKRFKVAAESEFSPDFGSITRQLRSRRMQKEFTVETYETRNVSDVCVLSSQADVELIPGEIVAERDSFKSVDCNDMSVGLTEGAESLGVNMQEPMKDRNMPENTSEQNMVEVHPPSISLPEEDMMGSVCRKSITGTKELHGRTISVGRDLSPNMGSKFSKNGKTAKRSISVEEENLVLEKSDSGDHLGPSPEVLELEKSEVWIITDKGVVMPSPVKPSEKRNRDYGEGSMRKNSERVSLDKKRLASKFRLSNGGLPSCSSSGDSARYKVKETMRLFHETCKKIMQEEEARPRKRDGGNFKVFKLRRIPGQPELPWKEVAKSKKSEFRDGLCNVDITEGKETLPICAVNNLDDEKPPPFIYTAKMIYPDWCRPIPPKSCGCTNGCSKSKNCACIVKNGGKIPYYDGAIVEIKPLVYECGPHCKCPPSCNMRVSQHGIKIKLEIFKTESRGWGVRSLESIPIGSFICEYAGELLEDKQAESLTGKDEYLFDLGDEDDPSV
ncbi:unnamed protein product [Arabidopsis thaliana]|uniref:(thale cress) hypothetical protein n=1 Tax=Arabidopsis thaliana TaxID=3702 RepID=A0A7G2EGH8_ARATH|nr:unnamed protein product [Arabidopsis thaliana]